MAVQWNYRDIIIPLNHTGDCWSAVELPWHHHTFEPYRWLLDADLTCKNRRPYNLYCVGGDVKPCSINQSINQWDLTKPSRQQRLVLNVEWMRISGVSHSVWLLLVSVDSPEGATTLVQVECLLMFSGVITGCRRSTTRPLDSQCPVVNSSLYAAVMTTTVYGLTSTGDEWYLLSHYLYSSVQCMVCLMACSTAVFSSLTLWCPLLPNRHGYKASCARPSYVMLSFVIFDIRTLWRPGLSIRVSGCQKLQLMA